MEWMWLPGGTVAGVHRVTNGPKRAPTVQWLYGATLDGR
jgi:hypothetical protein